MGEAAVVDQPSEAHPQEEELARYGYPEFTGPGGERYLKKMLHQILPMALYRTWEIFLDHQAKGNDCYLSVAQLAMVAGRSLRTMQKNLASLQARGLLVEHVGWKTFRGSGDHTLSRLVVIKDFSALYALAHEYHEWLHTTAMIPPERAFVALIVQSPMLVAKLQRFDNYRRLLSNQSSGSGKGAWEEDRWCADSWPPLPGQEARDQEEATQASGDHTPASKVTSCLTSKGTSEGTPKRISESSQREESRGDSSDSAASFSENSWRNGETDAPVLTNQPVAPPPKVEWKKPSEDVRQSAIQPPAGAWSRQSSSHVQHTGGRKPLMKAQEFTIVRQGTPLLPHAQSMRRQSTCTQDESLAPPDHPLARSFLQEIAAPFGDRNPKGSATRILRLLANASLETAEVVLCLVRAATIARQTNTLRPAHYDPHTGQANRMPLFCSLFERFVQARAQNSKWNYSWQQMEEDLAADDRLLLWWMEHQALLAQEPIDPPECPATLLPDAAGEGEGLLPSGAGWMSRVSAHFWGEQLLEALVAGGYEAQVRVHLEDQYYQLLLVGEDGQWILETPEQVQFLMQRLGVPADRSFQLARS